MDGPAFDRLTKTLTEPRSRRGMSRLLGGLAVGGPLALGGLAESPAKKKKRKVTLCHNGQTISVSKKAKKKHLKHGDTLGECPAPPPTCSDGVRNGSETDVDCGGSCPPCGVGQQCLVAGDCASGYCAGGQCVVGQGTCAAGTSACPDDVGPSTACNTTGGCHCVIANEGGATRCAQDIAAGDSNCGECTDDASCKAHHPAAFCAQGGVANRCCVGIEGICALPCAA